MTSPINDLNTLLASMSPELQPGVYVYASVPFSADLGDIVPLLPFPVIHLAPVSLVCWRPYSTKENLRTTMATQDKALALKKMKWFAAGLLVAAAALFLLAKSQHDAGAWAWVSAFAEAAMVAALAAWFPAFPLFRHPLGLPIPHTAILPADKARAADNL